ncbi:LysM peptidoglycan-binding domain-containing protein [Streptomyces roseolus]|uniref:LysM peptidoglycan-binding domain-containing protein n=1 Tax=Streptomyces roseolus TaxID=67358 RepID=UPI0036ECFB75
MRARRSLARRLPRALLSLVVLAAVTVGLPWILASATTAVWASGIDVFTHLLTRTDTGAAFLLALVAVGWIAWAMFIVSLLVEIPAQLRGRTAPRLPGLRLSQRAAGTLVSGILVLFASSTLASAAPALAAGPAATVPAATATVAPDTAHTQAAPQTAAPEKKAEQTYTVRAVRPAESLWSIAELLYGDGTLYTKIADANEGRTMVDGAVFHADAPIRPGWTLRLPDTPTIDAVPAPAPQGTAYTVTTGDNLWQVAEEQLGDGDRYTEIFNANKGKPQADGGRLTDPDDIHAGWKLTIPTAPPAEATPPPPTADTTPTPPPAKPAPAKPAPAATPAPAQTPPAPAASAPSPTAPPTTAPTAVPHQTKPPTPTRTATTVPSTAAPAPAAPTARQDTPAAAPSAPTSATPAAEPAAGSEEDDRSLLPQSAGIGMLAAGTFLLTLATARMIQRRRRKPGQLPAPVDNEAAEQALHAAADPGSLELLDLALRTLAHHATTRGVILPRATGARITDRSVELFVPAITHSASDYGVVNELFSVDDTKEEVPPLAPFTSQAPGRWVLDRDQALLDPDDALDVPAPYPGLVTLGTDPDGNHLLINLNVARVLLLDGTPTEVRDTARVLALEAATSTWSDHAEIITVGLGDELPALLPQSRLRAVPHLAAARADLAELLLEQRQQADGEDAPPRMPWTLVCATDIEETEARLLADTLTAARELPVALILPAQGTAGAFGAFDDAVHLAVGHTRPQHVDVLDTDLIVQSLPEADYQAFAEQLRQASQPAQPAEEPWTQVPPTPVTITTSGDTSAAGLPASPFAVFHTTRPLAPVPSPPAPTPAPALVPGPGQGGDTETETVEQNGGTPAGPHSTTEDTDSKPPADTATPAAAPAPPAPPAPEAGQSASEDEQEEEAAEEEADETVDLHAPEIQVLGPVTVTGIQASGHGPKLAQLAAYLYFKPGRPDAVREAMDPRSPWSPATLQNRISQLRSSLGSDPDAGLYLPRDRTGIYKLSPKVRCDWDRFLRLAERGLAKGPSTGIPDLEAALALVRGVPFGGTPPAWAAARHQEMLVRITDTAHTLATWHRTGPRPDLDAARRVIRQGLDIDDSAELLYQDWMQTEAQAGNRRAVQTAYETLLLVNRRLDVSTEPETEAIYEQIVSRSA